MIVSSSQTETLCISAPKQAGLQEVPATTRFLKEPSFFVLYFLGRILCVVALSLSLYPGLYYASAYIGQMLYGTILQPLALPFMMVTQLAAYAAMFPMPPGIAGILLILYSILLPVWQHATTGQTESARAAGFRETAAGGPAGAPPPPAARALKGLVLAAEGLAFVFPVYLGAASAGGAPLTIALGGLVVVPALIGVVALERALLSLLDGPLGVAAVAA